MSNFSTFSTSYKDIKNPEIKHFIDHLASFTQASIEQSVFSKLNNGKIKYQKLSVGKKNKVKRATVAEVIDNYLSKTNSKELKQMARNLTINKNANIAPFNYGSKLNIKSDKPIFNQLDLAKEFSYINDRLFLKVIAANFNIPTTTPTAPATPVANPTLTLKLNLKTVKCLDETNPEWGGKDNIAAGGVVSDDRGVETKISEFHVGNFDDGDVKNFNPVKVLKTYSLDNVHPSTFTAFLTLAEKDSGGFSDFIQELYDAIKDELTVILTALGAAAGAAIGAAIGGSVGTAVAGPIGTIIGVAAGLIIGALTGWIVSLLKDDVFEPQISGITIDRSAPFTGPTQRLTYRDFGGSYYMDVFWSAS